MPTAEGTLLITDEGQYGLLAWLQKLFVPRKLERLHDTWLAEIKRRAEERAAG